MTDAHYSTLDVTIATREDGGVHIWSDDLPGLILAGRNRQQMIDAIPPAVAAIARYQGANILSVEPETPLDEIMGSTRRSNSEILAQTHRRYLLKLQD